MAEVFHEDEHYAGRFDARIWLRLAAHVRPYARWIAAMIASGIVLGVTEIASPLIQARLVDGAIAAAAEAAAGGPDAPDDGDGASFDALFGPLLALYAALMVIFAACVWAFIRVAGRIATGVGADLTRKEFDRLQQLSFSYFDSRPTGWLVSRLTSDVTRVSSLIPWVCLDLTWGPFMILGISAAMFAVNAQLAAWVVAIIPPMVIVTAYFQRRMLASSRLIRRTNSAITASFNESILGVQTTKAMVREDAALRDFQRLSGDMRAHTLRHAMQAAAYRPLLISIASLGSGLAIWQGGHLLGLGTDPASTADAIAGATGLTVGELIAFFGYAGLLVIPVQDIALQFTRLQSGQAAAERIQNLLDTVPEVRDRPDVAERVAARAHLDFPRGVGPDGLAIDGGRPDISLVALRDVGFAYAEGPPVLADINLEARTGQTIALVGHTGSGKTTLVSLLSRFYEPTAGRIELDGVEYRDRSLTWLQTRLGIALQTPHLFSGSIRENIRYGRLDATDAEVEAAAAAVNADVFIRAAEQGFDADVGEGGGRLSTGQRQLIALARALLADPDIFILDEATSSVDTETERLIQAAIEAVLRDRIAFVIAHRLSTIRRADQILVLERGRIIERGHHEALLAAGGRYRELCMSQFAVV